MMSRRSLVVAEKPRKKYGVHSKNKTKSRKKIDALDDKNYARAMQILSAIKEDPFSGKTSWHTKGRIFCPCLAISFLYKIYKKELLISVIKFEHRKDIYR